MEDHHVSPLRYLYRLTVIEMPKITDFARTRTC
jgi:hypothetical protein